MLTRARTVEASAYHLPQLEGYLGSVDIVLPVVHRIVCLVTSATGTSEFT